MSEKKREILEAAKKLFNSQGYAKTSVDDISAAIGMRKSSLYYYFKNKEDIFIQASEDEWRRQFESFRNEANKQSSPEDKLITYIKTSLKYYEKIVVEKGVPIRAMVETRNLYRSFIDSINQGSIKFYAKCILEGQEAGDFKACDAENVSKTISLIKFSIQFDQLAMYLDKSPTIDDWNAITELIINATNLILNGIKK